MKYIKNFDSYKDLSNKISLKLYNYLKRQSNKNSPDTKFHKDDYVLTKDNIIRKISTVEPWIKKYWFDEDEDDPYNEDYIIRIATPQEINQFKFEKKYNTKKYNI